MGAHDEVSKRQASCEADIKILGSLNRDDLKKICGDNVPEWISFPVYEQVKWLNKQLTKLWPFVAEAATMVIRESVEPLLEEYRPPGITSLKFSKLSLGNVAPKIEGIRVQSLNKGQIIMDIDFRWGGDPSIILAVEAALVASIPIQLKDLEVFTIIRVIFQLAEEIPCISAVAVALLAEPKPRIDYTLKAVGGSLTAIPGISDMIDDTVNSIVTDTLQWPHRIVVPLGGIPVDTSELELKPHGRLKVTVVKANDLKNMEMIGKSDPYVVVYIRPLFKVKTKVIDNNLNPIWNQTFEMIAEDKETQSLTLEVFDEDIGQDKRLGIVQLPLIDLEAQTEKELELRLLSSLDTLKVKDKKDRGTLTIKVFYYQFNKEEQLAALEEEKKTLEERKKLRAEGVIGSTMEALDGAVSVVGSGVGMVGTGVVAGAGLVGSGVGAGAGLVGSGIGAGVGIVGSGFGAFGSGLTKAGKFMGRTITGQGASRRSGSSTPVTNAQETGGGAKPL
ncbi:calcium-dependent lipid-binding protein-like isoform X2 [Gastrolobium bilobum]|uniref:calcium-dependent lipid-binding protein-like isoform X2 n=1 Tax=Gastrolobium bilobum TaxID=150636 RepID=UPI002AB17334|nr:calcium-dependent lipid-binding protein-like isoform X2 [Gastrolobium bilobum]